MLGSQEGGIQEFRNLGIEGILSHLIFFVLSLSPLIPQSPNPSIPQSLNPSFVIIH
jgi:hypothetical protein